MMKKIVYFMFLSLLTSTGTCFGVTAEQLQQMLADNEKVTLIDVRRGNAYAKAHLVGAINIPARLCPVKNLPPLGRVVVYGDGIDVAATQNALNALNSKPGIQAEILNGGIGRWQTLGYMTTETHSLKAERLPIITYQELVKIATNNPDLVLVDLRRVGSASSTRSTRSVEKPLTDLATEFPGISILNAVNRTTTRSKTTREEQNSVSLNMAAIRDSNVYVLIDNLDGEAQRIARRLMAAGKRRFVILAGGEEIIFRKGKAGVRISAEKENR